MARKKDYFEEMGKGNGVGKTLKKLVKGRYVEAKARTGQRITEWGSRRREARALTHEAFLREKQRLVKAKAEARGIRKAQPKDLAGTIIKVGRTGKKLARQIPTVRFDKYGNPIVRSSRKRRKK